jgi:hypothetical protein
MRIKRAISAAAVTASLIAAVAPAASASDAAPASTTDCTAPALSNPLAAFGDTRHYFLAPGGSFDAGSPAWRLTGGAALTDNDAVLGLGADEGSLSLPAGATATSPVFCVDLDYPTFRFFAAQADEDKGKLSVDVIYPAIAQKKTEAAKVSKLDEDWTLTKDVPLKPATVDKAGGWRLVKLRFRAAADGPQWKVDDVLVDPRMRG